MRKVLIIVFIMGVTTLYGAPKSSLWSFWDKSNESNSSKIDYSEYDDFLKKYVVTSGENTLVKYSEVTDSDEIKLNRIIQDLSEISIRNYNRIEQKAYWSNLYNILTIVKILEYYPVKSIRDIRTSGLFKSGPWDEKVIKIEGQDVTLNDIEHRILRPIWNDNRIHFILNCASIGCPNLMDYAFTADNIEGSLGDAEKYFLRSNKGVTINGNKLILSSIFNWYQSDFGKNEKQMLSYIGSIIGSDLRSYSVQYKYDWNLNEIKKDR